MAPLPTPTKEFTGTRREMVQQIVSCIRDKGFPVKDPLPGDYSWRWPAGSDAVSYSWANYDCMMQVGDIPIPPLTDHNLKILYDTELKVADCVKGFGVAVKDPPTFEQYAQSRRNMEGEIWTAKSELQEGQANYGEIMDKCDQELLQTEPFEK